MTNCENCKEDFEITDLDQGFYNKMEVPEPTHCPDCRQQRRWAFRNPRVMYNRQCDLCQKKIVSVYSADKIFPVYCNDCWWSNKWDKLATGREFDFSRPFFEQFKELMDVTPKSAMLSSKNVNSEYTTHSSNSKNCFLCSVIFISEDCSYSDWIFDCKDIRDCSMVYENSELCYQSIWCFTCYDCQFCLNCKNSNNLKFCYDCIACHDCFLSSNLRNKSFVFKDEQLTEQEYKEKLAVVDLGSYETLIQTQKEYQQMRKEVVSKFAEVTKSINSTGDLMINCKNCTDSFFIINGEDSKYLWGCESVKDCMDSSGFGKPIGSELLYEIHGMGHGYNCAFSNMAYDVSNSQYISHTYNMKDCFGCCGIEGARHCILNKQYSEEEYKELRAKIIDHMKQTGEYGEFFPIELSTFGYNESVAGERMSLTKEEVLAKGWQWQDNMPFTTGKETINDIPDNINEVKDDFVSNIFACLTCQRNYKITPQDFKFYNDKKLPLPRECPRCRSAARWSQVNQFKLYHRQCMCEESGHDHDGPCSVEFETTYGLDRKEKIYCEKCYQKKIY